MRYWKRAFAALWASLILAAVLTALPVQIMAQGGLQQAPLDMPRDPLAERDAKHNLDVAKFYLKRKAYKAVTERLLEIVYVYPKFSRFDEVLSLLGEAFIKLDNKEEAAKFYRQLVKDFPESNFTKDARKQLESLPAEAAESGKSGVK